MDKSKEKRASDLLKKWAATFSAKTSDEKKAANAKNNFDDLLSMLKAAKIPSDLALSTLNDAIRIHIPNANLMKTQYRNMKQNGKTYGRTEAEFTQSWVDLIQNAGINCFYEWYPDDIQEEADKLKADVKVNRSEDSGGSDDPDDDRPKKSVMRKAQKELCSFAETWPELSIEQLAEMNLKRTGL